MPIPLKTSLKTLKTIRTSVSLLDPVMKPHKAYLRVGALEMERSRKLTERRAVQAKLDEIDARCAEIDAEKNYLLTLIGERPPQPKAKGDESESRESGEAASLKDSSGARQELEAVATVKESTGDKVKEKSERGMSSGGGPAGGDGTFTMRY